MTLSIPDPVIYAGLAGCVISLVVAVAQQKWSLKAFFLLTLRLAIGWHFMFEGLHKLHSFAVGETETNRPFSSAMYFNAGEGPLADVMRKRFLGDPDKDIQEMCTVKDAFTAAEFKKLSETEQAKHCPEAVAKMFNDADLKDGKDVVAKAKYARWVYGVDTKDAKVRQVSSDVPQGATDRMNHIRLMTLNLREYEDRAKVGLGYGNGVEMKRTAATKAELRAAVTSLAADAAALVEDLKKEGGWKPDPNTPKVEKPIIQVDRMTGWAITVFGACIFFGLFTRLFLVCAAGFLFMTYLTHPTVPWLPLPPMTEGNPVFINKNLIEAFACLALATFPTGRWLGLDALIHYCCFGKNNKNTSVTA